ncbi:MAG: DNA mismatch repair protein MutS [Flavobacteriaceae bacterium]|nr:DNA mismatch repair protein MutS [Flavobacteriaceae bacterium]
MSLKVGDYVEVLDEDLSGKVISVENNNVTIQTEDGFELEFETSQLLKSQSTKLFRTSMITDDTLQKIHTDKNPKKKKSVGVKRKERTQPAMEVDLHIHQLLPNTKGMQKHDILTYQLDTVKRQLAFAMSKNIQRIVFIHGVGEGVLKMELEYLLKQYDNLKYYDANYQKYGLGATEVYIYQNA